MRALSLCLMTCRSLTEKDGQEAPWLVLKEALAELAKKGNVGLRGITKER